MYKKCKTCPIKDSCPLLHLSPKEMKKLYKGMWKTKVTMKIMRRKNIIKILSFPTLPLQIIIIYQKKKQMKKLLILRQYQMQKGLEKIKKMEKILKRESYHIISPERKKLQQKKPKKKPSSMAIR